MILGQTARDVGTARFVLDNVDDERANEQRGPELMAKGEMNELLFNGASTAKVIGARTM